MLSVVVIDDHPIVRAGIRAVLGAADDLRVAAEGASGAEALRLAAEYHPDVLVLDLNLPDMPGRQVAEILARQPDGPALLVLTIHDDNETVFGLLECGVSGYVLKDEALEVLPHAVRAAARGENWLSPAIAAKVVRRSLTTGPELRYGGPELRYGSPELRYGGPTDHLTPAELNILRLLAQGLDNAAIAARLFVTRRTVQNHVSHIYAKLRVATRTEAALLAIRAGLVQVDADEG